MTFVADMLAPRISADAIDLAHRMRMLMGQDSDEFEIARQIEDANESINRTTPQLLQQAWSVLNSTERAAWKAWLTWRERYERK